MKCFIIQGDGESRTIKQIHYTVWPDKGTPEYGNSVLSYRNKVKSYSYLPGQLLVHCRYVHTSLYITEEKAIFLF